MAHSKFGIYRSVQTVNMPSGCVEMFGHSGPGKQSDLHATTLTFMFEINYEEKFHSGRL